jgi:hypothetical protein
MRAQATKTRKSLRMLAGPTGFEPATSCVTGRRSNQTELRPRMQNLRYREKPLFMGLLLVSRLSHRLPRCTENPPLKNRHATKGNAKFSAQIHSALTTINPITQNAERNRCEDSGSELRAAMGRGAVQSRGCRFRARNAIWRAWNSAVSAAPRRLRGMQPINSASPTGPMPRRRSRGRRTRFP